VKVPPLPLLLLKPPPLPPLPKPPQPPLQLPLPNKPPLKPVKLGLCKARLFLHPALLHPALRGLALLCPLHNHYLLQQMLFMRKKPHV
jgi:hypothetical protein